MAITTYAELKTAVANYLNRDDLTSRIPEFVALAEDRIRQDTRLRVRAMETSNASFTIDSRTESLPTRFIAMRRFYLNSDPVKVLEYLAPDSFWSRWAGSETGQPVAYTIEGENFVFGPAPDTSYTGTVLYYQSFAALSSDSDTNWILTNARGLLLYGALLESAPYIGDDPRLVTWAALYDDMAEKVERADKRDRFPPGVVSRPLGAQVV